MVRVENNSIGSNFLELLLILFIGLKLGNVIDWPWFWVLSPIWIGIILVVVLTIMVLAFEEKR